MPRILKERGVRLLDAMVVIAMLGFGLALAREPYLRMDRDMVFQIA